MFQDVRECVSPAIPRPIWDGQGLVVQDSDETRSISLGEISICPRALAEAIRTKGDLAMKARQCRSMIAMLFATHAGGGSPMSSRN